MLMLHGRHKGHGLRRRRSIRVHHHGHHDHDSVGPHRLRLQHLLLELGSRLFTRLFGLRQFVFQPRQIGLLRSRLSLQDVQQLHRPRNQIGPIAGRNGRETIGQTGLGSLQGRRQFLESLVDVRAALLFAAALAFDAGGGLGFVAWKGRGVIVQDAAEQGVNVLGRKVGVSGAVVGGGGELVGIGGRGRHGRYNDCSRQLLRIDNSWRQQSSVELL